MIDRLLVEGYVIRLTLPFSCRFFPSNVLQSFQVQGEKNDKKKVSLGTLEVISSCHRINNQ